MNKYVFRFSILHVVLILLPFYGNTCSMYKLTKDGETVIGSNEDQWRTTPHIWFEKGTKGNYNCCFTGSRSIGNNKYAAQSGMNEHGLTFTRLASFHPMKVVNKPKIDQPDLFLMDVMRTCMNIKQVYEMVDQYDRTCFIEDVLVYIESSGDYLIVEPYSLIRGNDPTFVQANFCPSITTEKDRRKQERYRNGKDYLTNGYSTTPSFCRELSSTMHVCRDKVGDGTLLTSIWNTKSLDVTLYFYHNYDEKVVFNLKDEFSKGDHQFDVSSLFTRNEEFEHLKSYITPFNTNWIRILLALIGLQFILTACYFGVTAFTRRSGDSKLLRILFFFAFLIFFSYMFVLTTNIGIYYFPSPYVHSSSSLITLSSYSPYLIILLLATIIVLHFRKRFFKSWSGFSRGILVVNSFTMVCLLFAFFYWGIL